MIEIILLVAGGIVFVLSFLIPSGEEKGREQAVPVAREEIKDMVSREMDAVKSHVDDVVEEAVSYAMEKTERSLERLSNEKIMAINEYSDTVLAEIHKSHEEAVFLYDMLNSKHDNLKNTVSEVNRTVKEAEETVNSIQRLAPEAAETPKEAPVSGREERTPKAAFVRMAEEQIAKAVNEADELSVPQQNRGKMPEGSGGNSNERILMLYSQGKSDIQIARELGLGVGEVKLVIDLFNG